MHPAHENGREAKSALLRANPSLAAVFERPAAEPSTVTEKLRNAWRCWSQSSHYHSLANQSATSADENAEEPITKHET